MPQPQLLKKLTLLVFRIRYNQIIMHSSLFEVFSLCCMGLVASYLVYNGSISVTDLIISDLLGEEYHSLPEEEKVPPNESPEEEQKRKARAKLYDTGFQCLFVILVIGGLVLGGIAPYYL